MQSFKSLSRLVSEIWAKQVLNGHFKHEGGAIRWPKFKYMHQYSLNQYVKLYDWTLPKYFSHGWFNDHWQMDGQTDGHISNSTDPCTL